MASCVAMTEAGRLSCVVMRGLLRRLERMLGGSTGPGIPSDSASGSEGVRARPCGCGVAPGQAPPRRLVAGRQSSRGITASIAVRLRGAGVCVAVRDGAMDCSAVLQLGWLCRRLLRGCGTCRWRCTSLCAAGCCACVCNIDSIVSSEGVHGCALVCTSTGGVCCCAPSSWGASSSPDETLSLYLAGRAALRLGRMARFSPRCCPWRCRRHGEAAVASSTGPCSSWLTAGCVTRICRPVVIMLIKR
jgi:hypothetical protein